jgi:SHS2 domain-containing protein
MAHWEHFEHGADIGVRGIGGTPAVAFAQAAVALTAIITYPEQVRPVQEITVACGGDDLDMLLFAWLNTVVFEMATRHSLFSRFAVEISGAQLTARLAGEPVDRERHAPAVEVKAATLCGLRVARQADGEWVAECVVDV